jgi:hypothetical protein
MKSHRTQELAEPFPAGLPIIGARADAKDFKPAAEGHLFKIARALTDSPIIEPRNFNAS